jgi:peptidoglycan L-alanyl-D-glutamate endopeptidase CwlK
MFGNASQSKLNTCAPDLQVIFTEVERQLALEGLQCSIFCGHRNQADQRAAYLSNNSQLDWPNSLHNTLPSMAVDSGPYFIEIKNTDWNDRIAFAVYAGRVLQIAAQLLREGKVKHKLTWGGDWDMDGRNLDQKFHDLPHFQLVGQ